MNISCDVVTDLLPLYHDGVCNASTKKLVEEHLETCDSCRALLDKMSNTTLDSQIKTESQDIIRHQAKALKMRYIQNIGAVVFSILFLLGIITCIIVDLAICGTLTWSIIPVSSIVLAWCSFFPAVKYGAKGVPASLIALSVLIVPYFFGLNQVFARMNLIVGPFLSIAIGCAAVGIAFMWALFALFTLLKSRKLLASAIALILVIPFDMAINFILSRTIGGPIFEIWDALSAVILVAAAGLLFHRDYVKRKRAHLDKA